MRATGADSHALSWAGPVVVGLVAAAGTVLERSVAGPWHDSMRILSSVPELPLEIPLLLLWGLVVDWMGLRLSSYRGQDHFDRTARALMGAAVAVLAVVAWDVLTDGDVSVPSLLPLGFLVLGLMAPALLSRHDRHAQGGRGWSENGSTLQGGLRY